MISTEAKQATDSLSDRPTIFRYHDYREFLRRWFEFLKQTDPNFSMRELSRRAGLSSAYLSYVVAGHRDLSGKALEKFLPVLNLSEDERSFLELLRVLSDGESEVARFDAFKKIHGYPQYQKLNPKEIEACRYMEHWYFVAIRELASLRDFRADPKWIGPRLNHRVTTAEIREALSFLVQKGFIEIKPTGEARPCTKDIDCVGGVYRLVLRNFHRQMHLLSGTILDSPLATDQRYVSGYTLSFPASRFAEMKQVIDEAINKIEALGRDAGQPDTVYHVNFLAVPVSVPQKGDGDEDDTE